MSAQYLAGLNFDGYAVGGLSIGEPLDLTLEMTYETIHGRRIAGPDCAARGFRC